MATSVGWVKCTTPAASTVRRRSIAASVLGAVVALSMASSAMAFPPGNRVVDPGAEDPLMGAWQSSGFASVLFGQSPSVPAAPFLGDGARLFAAQGPNATLAQTVDVADLGAAIDESARGQAVPGLALRFGAGVGARGPRADLIRIALQPLDGAGGPLADPVVAGPQTPDQRQNLTRLLDCAGTLRPPAGTRAVRITLDAPGGPDGVNTAFADRVYVTAEAADYHGTDPNGCQRIDPIATPPSAPARMPTSAPKLTSLVTMSPRTRCRRTAMRFRVKDAWRSRVRRLSLTAGTRSISHDPRRTARFLLLAPPRTTMRVRIRVQLLDGRLRTGTVRYHACR